MNHAGLIIIPLLAIYAMSVYSCDKNHESEDLEPPGPSDTILLEDLSNCDADNNGQLTFEYQDTIYQFTNPPIKAYIDTLPGSAFFLPDSSTFYRKTIVIEVPMSYNQVFIMTIEEVEDPFSSCLALKEYYEKSYSNYENGLIYCFWPNPENLEMTLPLCTSANVTLKTIREDYMGYTSSNGSMEVTRCENGLISGYFEGELFKKGRFCSVNVDWH